MDDYVREFEQLFESSYGHRTDVDMTFKEILKRDIFVQGLLLKWQEKVLPSAVSFADALYQARAAEKQEKQLGAMHPKAFHSQKEGFKEAPGKSARGDNRPTSQDQPAVSRGTGSRDMSQVQCYKCHGYWHTARDHTARDCPLRRQATEARGSGGSGSSSTVMGEVSEDPSSHCRKLQ